VLVVLGFWAGGGAFSIRIAPKTLAVPQCEGKRPSLSLYESRRRGYVGFSVETPDAPVRACRYLGHGMLASTMFEGMLVEPF
jgi:hypothetical protein